MFERVVVAVEGIVLGLWAGAMAGFAFLFAPVAFRTVARMDTFSMLVGATIRSIGSFGTACGAAAIAAALVRSREPQARPIAALRIVLVASALGASAYEANVIVPRMDAIAARIPGPIDSVAKSDPRRAAYDAEHAVSTKVYGAAFLCVVGALALAAFGRRG